MRAPTKLFAVVGLAIFARPSLAMVNTYTDKAAWEAAVGAHSSITFTELPNFAWISEQYANLGVHFTDGSDQIYASNLFPTDGMGLNGAFDSSTLEFDAPITSLALEFPGGMNVKFYSGGNLIYAPTGDFGGSGSGWFIGFVSMQPFDKAFIYDPAGDVFVDNLYFGPPIPAPGSLTFFALSMVHGRSRRRR